MPIFAPYINSYRRLSRFMAAPINVQWGYDNRTVGFRIPQSGASARRIENRFRASTAIRTSRSPRRSRPAISA